MVSVSWDKFKALYAVETVQGYTETEIGLLKKIFCAMCLNQETLQKGKKFLV